MPNYIVDPVNGADPNSGLTESTAWRTIKKATDTLLPGDFGRLRGGIYLDNDGSAGLRTKRSGAAGSPITFQAYGDETVNIKHQYGGAAIFHSYIALKKLNFLNDNQNSGMGQGIFHWGTSPIDHVLLEDCHVRNIKEAESPNGIRMEMVNDSIVRRCSADYIGTAPQPGPENGNAIWIGGDRNLVEYCQTDHAGHAGLFMLGDRNVVRRSEFIGTWGVPGEYLCYSVTNKRTVVEDCIFRNASYLEDGLWRNPTWQQMGSGTIFRRNLLYSGIGAGIAFYSRSDYQTKFIRAYFNVIYNCGGVIPPNYIECPYQLNEDVAATMGDIIVKNNINFANRNNNRATFAGYASAADIAFLSCLWNDTDPMFVDALHGNFRLQPGSPAIDAGEFLTRTITSGSGRVVSVQDASYFCDGWGIVEGDYVQLEGRTDTAKIVTVDYANNRITIDRDWQWTAGQGISLPFSGARPDIGAFEYAASPDFALSANPNLIIVTRGKSGVAQIGAMAINGFSGSVALSVSGLPNYSVATMTPPTIVPGQNAALTIGTSTNTPPGDHPVKVTGEG